MEDCGKRAILVLVCILVLSSESVHSEKGCPASQVIYPCSCKYTYFSRVECRGLESSWHLKAIMSEFKGFTIDQLKIEYSNLGDVPGNAFKGVDIRELRFHNTNLTSMGKEGNLPFTGLENSLAELNIDSEKLLKRPLRLGHLKRLGYLQLENVEIFNLGNDWFSDGSDSLAVLFVFNCSVKQVGDKAFSRLENLRYLHFTNNFVTLKRSALPEKALHLQTISLWGNGIKEIPVDFFKDLPSLKKVDLWDNVLTSMPQDTWESILPQLSGVSMIKNPLVCDSKLKWIFDQNYKIIDGFCALPKRLDGMEIINLKKEDLD